MPKTLDESSSNQAWKGLAAVTLAAGLWAAAATVASALFDRGVSPVELSEARAVIATLGFALIPAAWGSAGRKRAPADSRGLWTVAALGLALALVNLVYYLAIDRLAVAVAIVLQYSAPALVVAWSTLVSKRRPPTPVIVALIVAITGVVLVSEVLAGDLGRFDVFGIAMGLASAILFAAYTLLSEPAQVSYGPLRAVFRAFAFASVFWIVVQIPRGWPEELFRSENILPVMFVGLAGTMAPFLLYVWGVAQIRAERASIAATLEPVLAALFAWIWLSESLSFMQLAGGAMVITAVVALQRNPRSSSPA